MIAFVLSGGGNRGAVQIGALLALLERNIYPDLIIGTSVGALNGVALAADPTLEGMQRVAENWRNVRGSDIFPGNPLTVGWRILTRQGSLHDHGSFQRFVLDVLPPSIRRFGDLRRPCIVTATVLRTGRLRLFGTAPDDPVVDGVLASTAIPPFFPPYHYQNEWLIDGAVVANLPLAQAIIRGARTIYALDIVDEVAPVTGRNLGQTLTYALSAMISQQDELERRIVALGHRRGVTIHDIRLTSGQRLAYNDFRSSASLIESGHRAVTDYLAALPSSRPAPHRRIADALRGAFRTMSTLRSTVLPPA